MFSVQYITLGSGLDKKYSVRLKSLIYNDITVHLKIK